VFNPFFNRDHERDGMELNLTLNGQPVSITIGEEVKLLTLLRDQLGLTGTKAGCETGHCGSCSVIVDGKLKKSCQFPARLVNGKRVITIEGIHDGQGGPNDIQLALLKHGATQCGYCIPGIVIAAEVLLSNNPNPTRLQIREAISSNICRCTGYQQIVDAIEEAAAVRRASALGREETTYQPIRTEGSSWHS
jgi:aerobic carbon-monoxide dehydrogenase small subunit